MSESTPSASAESLPIALASDHGGFHLKDDVRAFIEAAGYTVLDCGAFSDESTDYPDWARAGAEAVAEGRAARAILLCGSGVGVTVAANKVRGIRACLCHDSYSARQGVEHDDMNVLCLGARIIGRELAGDLVRNFLGATFSGEDRHCRRLQKVLDIEAASLAGTR